jgi:hypothetical protein
MKRKIKKKADYLLRFEVELKDCLHTLFTHNNKIKPTTIIKVTLVESPTCFNPCKFIFRDISLFDLQGKSSKAVHK